MITGGSARGLALVAIAVLVLTSRAAAQDGVEELADDSLTDAALAEEIAASEASTGTASQLGAPIPPPGYETRPPSVPSAPSDTSVEDEERITRLDAVLLGHARGSRGGRIEGGILALVAGLVIVGAGITMMSLEDGHDPLWFILGGISMALGVGTATTGAIDLAMTTSPERRYAAFQRDRAAGTLTARRVGRYEGALWSEAEAAADVRLLGIASAVLLAANGAVLVGFTAQFATDDTFRAIGYGGGALYVALGVLQLVLSFEETDAERRFRQYEDGAPMIAVSPWASPNGGGVIASGTF
jgi:hypothetical protein